MKDLITYSKWDWIMIIAFVFLISFPISFPYIIYRIVMRYTVGKPLYDDPDNLLPGDIAYPNLVSVLKGGGKG